MCLRRTLTANPKKGRYTLRYARPVRIRFRSSAFTKKLHEQVIAFDPDHFLALINVSENRAYHPRKKALVAMAQKTLGAHPWG